MSSTLIIHHRDNRPWRRKRSFVISIPPQFNSKWFGTLRVRSANEPIPTCTYDKAARLSLLLSCFLHSDFKSNKARDLHRQHYIHGDTRNPTDVVRQASSLSLRPATSHQDRSHLAAGRASFDTHTIDKRPPIRPHTSMSDCKSCRHRRLSVVTVFSCLDRPSLHPSASKLSFHSHLDSLNERYDHGSNGYKRGSIGWSDALSKDRLVLCLYRS